VTAALARWSRDVFDVAPLAAGGLCWRRAFDVERVFRVAMNSPELNAAQRNDAFSSAVPHCRLDRRSRSTNCARASGIPLLRALVGTQRDLPRSDAGSLDQDRRMRCEGSNYLRSGSSLEVTADNWKSEFLQMAVYVLFTASLFQSRSSESKSPDETEEVDRDPRASTHKSDAPWPVRAGACG
jgi:hypothetical protein